ncbi:MAG: hypothetical protein RAK22_01815 [Nanoarchaeota archaeon]|nr:hypothetical protein [Nanoarchaeota archaeon]
MKRNEWLPFVFTERGVNAFLENLYNALTAFENFNYITDFLDRGATGKPSGNPLVRVALLKTIEYLRQINYFIDSLQTFQIHFKEPITQLIKAVRADRSSLRTVTGYVFSVSPPFFHTNFNRKLMTATVLLKGTGIAVNALIKPEDYDGPGWYRFNSARVYPYVNRLHQRKISTLKVAEHGDLAVSATRRIMTHMLVTGTPITYELSVRVWNPEVEKLERCFINVLNASVVQKNGELIYFEADGRRYAGRLEGEPSGRTGAYVLLKRFREEQGHHFLAVPVESEVLISEGVLSDSAELDYVAEYYQKMLELRSSGNITVETIVNRMKTWADFCRYFMNSHEDIRNAFLRIFGANITGEGLSVRELKRLLGSRGGRILWIFSKYLRLMDCRDDVCLPEKFAWNVFAGLKAPELAESILNTLLDRPLTAGGIASLIGVPEEAISVVLEELVQDGKAMKVNLLSGVAAYCKSGSSCQAESAEEDIRGLIICALSLLPGGMTQEKLRYYLNALAVMSGSMFFTRYDLESFIKSMIRRGDITRKEEIIVTNENFTCGRLSLLTFFEKNRERWESQGLIAKFEDMYMPLNADARCRMIREYIETICSIDQKELRRANPEYIRERLRIECLKKFRETEISICVSVRDLDHLIEKAIRDTATA